MNASPVDAPFAPERAARRPGNNFGVLRLCLAGLVICGHAPELIDGDQRREIVHLVAGQGSVGAAALTGFFLLSGFLITQSMLSTGAVGPYIVKRVLRIVPGFFVAYVLSVFLLAPALGAPIAGQWWPALRNLIFLHQPPMLFGAVEPHYRTINGALWTISFEFRCYLLIAALWLVGILQRPRLLASATLIVIGASVVANLPAVAVRIDRLTNREAIDLIVGTPSRLVGFVAVFLIGACMFQFRARVLPRLSGWAALAGAVLMLPALAIPVAGTLLFTLLFATVLFWIALKADLGPWQLNNERWDVSYGTYLYGWPSAMAIMVLVPGITPLPLALAALLIALICGAASWWGVERWFKLKGGALFGMRLRWLAPADQPAI